MNVAPVSTPGSVQVSALTRQLSNGSTESLVQETLYVNLDSYIWEPWLVGLGADLALAHELGWGTDAGSSLMGSADATFSVLPLSDYPVTLNFAHIDSRASGDFGASDYTRDRAALSARANLETNLRTGLNASIERTDREDSGLFDSQNISFDMSKTFSEDEQILGISSVDIGGSYRHNIFTADDPLDDDRDRQSIFFRMNTVSRPIEGLTYDHLLTVGDEDFREGSDTFKRFSLQGVSSLLYRPEDEPYVITGSFRSLLESIEDADDSSSSSSDTLLASGTLGVRWPVHDRLSLNAGVRGSYQDVDRDEGVSTPESGLSEGQGLSATFLAGLNYTSEKEDVAGYEWTWNGRVQTENGLMEDEGYISRDSVSVGHRFQRQLTDSGQPPLYFAFNQQLETGLDTARDDDVFGLDLSQSVSLNYSKSEPDASTAGQLSLRDRRSLIGEYRESQSLLARFSQRVAIDRDRRLQGSLVAQFSRDADEDDEDYFLVANGDLSYEHRNLYDIENLGFRSELRVSIVDIETLFGGPDDEIETETFRTDWRNILSYRIGRATAELEGSAYQRGTDLGYLALIRLRREFGGYD